MQENFSIVQNLESFFDKKIQSLDGCEATTRAYIVNLFKTAKKQSDYSKNSLTLVYAQAKFEQKFDLFQNLGDWILFAETLFPQSLDGASEEYYNCLAQNAYYSCYRLLNRQWKLYEELADNFPRLTRNLQAMLKFDESSQVFSSSSLVQI